MKASISAAMLTVAATASLLLAGCARHHGDIDETGGITAVRSVCPIVGVPSNTGDVTLFDPVTSRDSTAIDLVGTMTNVRSTCDDSTDQIGTTVTFDIEARRTHTDGARDVTLPYFITVVRGGNVVVAKRVASVVLHFDAGQPRAHASGTASSAVSRAAATLPDEIREKLSRKRKAGDADAAIDPLTQPDIRKAVASATFEALVGFQLTDEQLKYNATR